VRRALQVPDAPQAIGPYSQAQMVEMPGARWIHTSGQIALDPATGQMVAGGVREQTERVLRNLAAVLAGGGCTLGDVVKTTVYLADMQDFQEMNEVYAKHFGEAPPARSTVAAAGLPKNARVEIDAIAVRRNA
jgi:2-iminobutanoate/2-iminopropanoate deaminase